MFSKILIQHSLFYEIRDVLHGPGPALGQFDQTGLASGQQIGVVAWVQKITFRQRCIKPVEEILPRSSEHLQSMYVLPGPSLRVIWPNCALHLVGLCTSSKQGAHLAQQAGFPQLQLALCSVANAPAWNLPRRDGEWNATVGQPSRQAHGSEWLKIAPPWKQLAMLTSHHLLPGIMICMGHHQPLAQKLLLILVSRAAPQGGRGAAKMFCIGPHSS